MRRDAMERRSGARVGAATGKWRRACLTAAALAALGSTGCSLDGLLNSDELPRDVSDPAITETPQGARIAYNGAFSRFLTTFGRQVVPDVGELTDELVRSGGSQGSGNPLDSRQMPDSYDGGPYALLHAIRGQTTQAIGLLTRYLPEEPALAGHLYTIKGYAELLLAELYCSGIPLSTVDFDGDYTYRPGSSTEEVLAHAVALFDTALTLAQDSTRFMHLARLGRARGLLGLGTYAEAAAAVGAVPDGYRYELNYTTDSAFSAGGSVTVWYNFAKIIPGSNGSLNGAWGYSVPDREGFNGMDWQTSDDPRSRVTQYGVSGSNSRFPSKPIYHPDKYPDVVGGADPIVLGSGVEARLVEAEADLSAGGGAWLATLNALRTDGTFSVDTQVVGVDTTVDSTVTPPDTTYDTTFAHDTLWNAGSGGVDGLGPLADPGTEESRVDLLFRERAFWLFLTGQRQGDLRRLIRQYGRVQGSIYPTGTYFDGFPYGADVTIPVPQDELVNPLFTGCISRDA